MTEHVPVFIVTIPLAAAVLVPLVALRSARLARGVMFLALSIVTGCAALALARVIQIGAIHSLMTS
jgi:hypothetical protein